VADINKRRADRNRVLMALYDMTDTTGAREVERSDLVEATGLGKDDVDESVQWLLDRSYANSVNLAGHVYITPIGVDLAETIAGDSDLPPLALTVAESRVLEVFVREARQAIEASSLDGEAMADAEAQLATIEAQARSPRPRRDVISAAIRALTWVAGAVLGGVLGNAAYDKLPGL
jgi:hypothetical protein